jgi:hypothetical protein
MVLTHIDANDLRDVAYADVKMRLKTLRPIQLTFAFEHAAAERGRHGQRSERVLTRGARASEEALSSPVSSPVNSPVNSLVNPFTGEPAGEEGAAGTEGAADTDSIFGAMYDMFRGGDKDEGVEERGGLLARAVSAAVNEDEGEGGGGSTSGPLAKALHARTSEVSLDDPDAGGGAGNGVSAGAGAAGGAGGVDGVTKTASEMSSDEMSPDAVVHGLRSLLHALGFMGAARQVLAKQKRQAASTAGEGPDEEYGLGMGFDFSFEGGSHIGSTGSYSRWGRRTTVALQLFLVQWARKRGVQPASDLASRRRGGQDVTGSDCKVQEAVDALDGVETGGGGGSHLQRRPSLGGVSTAEHEHTVLLLQRFLNVELRVHVNPTPETGTSPTKARSKAEGRRLLLSRIVGRLVRFPTHFLEDEELLPSFLAAERVVAGAAAFC